MRNAEIFAAAFGLLIVFGLAFWFTAAVWGECRESGHSVVYCVRMISR